MSDYDKVSSKPCFFIMSGKTGNIYVDENGTCHVYHEIEAAERFARNVDKAFVSSPETLTRNDVMARCYKAGGNYVKLHFERNDQIVLQEDYVRPDFYNHRLANALAVVMETRRKADLKRLSQCRIVMPVRVTNNDDGVEIVYGTAKLKDDDAFVYIGFTNLDEYDAWSKESPGFEPIRLDYPAIAGMVKKHGLVFNPCGKRFVIFPEMGEMIPVKRQEINDEEEY